MVGSRGKCCPVGSLFGFLCIMLCWGWQAMPGFRIQTQAHSATLVKDDPSGSLASSSHAEAGSLSSLISTLPPQPTLGRTAWPGRDSLALKVISFPSARIT